MGFTNTVSAFVILILAAVMVSLAEHSVNKLFYYMWNGNISTSKTILFIDTDVGLGGLSALPIIWSKIICGPKTL